jgi:hypothetical protein
MKFLLFRGGPIMEEVRRIESVLEQNAEENIGPNGQDVAG